MTTNDSITGITLDAGEAATGYLFAEVPTTVVVPASIAGLVFRDVDNDGVQDTGEVVGGLAIRLLPPFDEDLELSWQLSPKVWGRGYASEAATALARWAFTQDIDELFAVARPTNTRAIAVARRIGMDWVGETAKYYDLRLQVFRIRPSDLS